MGTTVIYNGVEMQNVLTRQWDQSIQYDESNTDMLHHRFNLRFEAVLHTLQYNATEPLGAFAMSMNAQQISTRYRDVRELLAQPRGRLEVYMGNQLVFACYPSAGSASSPDRDVDNGPKVKDLAITHVAGDRAFRVTFAIECCKVECMDGGAPPVVLNNRWQISEDMDTNAYITRTISGRLRLSLPGATTPNGPYQVAWRNLVVPSLEYGFRRDRMEFTCAKNGLDCDYTVVDRQIHTAAPWPATKMQCAQSESTSDAITMMSEITVHLEGPPHVDKRMLIARAIQVIDARLQFIDPKYQQNLGEEFMVENCYITEHIGEEAAIDASVRLRRTMGDVGSFLGNLRTNVLGKPLSLDPWQGNTYSPQVSTPPSIYGYDPNGNEDRLGVLAVLQCYLQSPCGGDHGISQPNTPPTIVYEDVSDGPPGSGQTDEYTLETTDVDKIREHARRAVYTAAAVQSSYEADDLTVILPLAGAVGGDTCRAIQLGAGRCMRTITFDAERVGGWPLIPEPVVNYSDGSLRARRIRYRLVPQPPTLSADKRQYIYRVRGEYTYALNRPPTGQEKLRTGALPFTSYGVSETQFDTMQAYDVTRGP